MPSSKRLSRVYVDAEIRPEVELLLPAPAAHYLKHVLRLQTADQVLLFNGRLVSDYLCDIRLHGKQVYARPLTERTQDVESPLATTLIQAIGKSEHMDLLIQKATELGIRRFILFNSKRTQSPLKGARLEKRLQHWRGVAISACEQCGRNQLPEMDFANDLSSALASSPPGNKILLDFAGQSLNHLLTGCVASDGFALLIGAEGGLTASEIELAREQGFQPCVIGPRTLRMETAAIAMVALIQHRMGDSP
ncbi:MAG: 16S rRNA (uracil(1498)-N(3))-methyltransferase [Gammaproteobacteria bacterium]|nr:16S rRNA (uracil(1498)-N(3))-methyltransferase [Gammaproteobacteria bacterium]